MKIFTDLYLSKKYPSDVKMLKYTKSHAHSSKIVHKVTWEIDIANKYTLFNRNKNIDMFDPLCSIQLSHRNCEFS